MGFAEIRRVWLGVVYYGNVLLGSMYASVGTVITTEKGILCSSVSAFLSFVSAPPLLASLFLFFTRGERCLQAKHIQRKRKFF